MSVIKMPDGKNTSGKNAIGKKCQMVKMPDGKNTTKRPFCKFFCVIFTFGISEHEVHGT